MTIQTKLNLHRASEGLIQPTCIISQALFGVMMCSQKKALLNAKNTSKVFGNSFPIT